jgi:transcriptional regulator GlxA family with amidase domain
MRIAILAIEGSVLSAISGIADMFWIANYAVASSPQHAARFENDPFQTVIVSPDGGPVWDVQGRLIHIDSSFQSVGQPDVIIAPGMVLGNNREPVNMLGVKEAAVWLRKQYDAGSIIASTGTGGFILGEAGLLDGKSFSTTWWFYHTMRERYPLAQSQWGKVLEEDGRVLTTGGCFSWISLVLHIIQKGAGADVAKLAAGMSLTDNDSLCQHLYVPPGLADNGHPLLLRAQDIIRFKNPSISAAQLAEALNTTERTLQRKLKALTQEKPKEFITRIRIESACVMLANPTISIRQVVTECGYSEETAFRKAFTQIMGMAPARYRQWLADKASPQG